jgi:putative PIG3 family NAD(P)H quinone oxidoreductase
MHAVTLESFGPPEVMGWGEVDDAVAGPGEVLVEVAAAGVNRADLMQREGHYPPPPGASQILGLECAGHVASLGPGTASAGWAVGDLVCALLSGGGYAELVAVPVGQLLPIPAGTALIDAAGLPESACTVWSTVFGHARLQPGQALLVHGGTSGIGTFAIQFARANGVRVFATAGSAAKCERAQELGAELAVNYREDDFVTAVRDATGGRGVDVVLDVVGGSYLERNLEVLAMDGELVVIATQGGRRAELDFGALMRKRATVYSGGLRARPTEQKAAIVAAVREHVWPTVESGEVEVIVQAVVGLDDAAQGHRILEAGDHVGKVILARPE